MFGKHQVGVTGNLSPNIAGTSVLFRCVFHCKSRLDGNVHQAVRVQGFPPSTLRFVWARYRAIQDTNPFRTG